MAVTRVLARRRDRGARQLYERYGARPWHLLDEPTRAHFRHLVAEGIDGAGRPLTPGDFRRRRRGSPAAGY